MGKQIEQPFNSASSYSGNYFKLNYFTILHQLKKIQHHLVIVMLPLFVFVFATQNFAGNSMLSDIDFISYAIKDAYVGYRDKVKGNEFDDLVKRAKRNSQKDTFAVLSKLTSFFKDHHMLLFDFNISKQLIDTVQCKKDSQMIRRYFDSEKGKDEYEGYWLSDFNYCVIALKKVKDCPITYYGYVVESKVKAIPGYCILKMVQQKDGTYYTDYTEENLGYRLFLHARFKNKNILWLNSSGGRWQRIKYNQTNILKDLTTLSYKPEFSIIDDNTAMLRMQDFSSYHIKIIDSIIKANDMIISKVKTLIVDIRNNAGGTIDCYIPLLPYIYTNPIVHCGSYDFYGDLYIQDYANAIQGYLLRGDTATAKTYIDYFDKVKAKKGEFDYTIPDTLAKHMPILPSPKNVAVIVNNNCISAAELMILNFKQSKKVKFFGERTGGAIDYLNAMYVPVYSGRYSLLLATAKREITKQEPSYDGKGIAPDVEIDDTVTDWVKFVKEYYDQHQ